jgi:hypothetical protein
MLRSFFAFPRAAEAPVTLRERLRVMRGLPARQDPAEYRRQLLADLAAPEGRSRDGGGPALRLPFVGAPVPLPAIKEPPAPAREPIAFARPDLERMSRPALRTDDE